MSRHCRSSVVALLVAALLLTSCGVDQIAPTEPQSTAVAARHRGFEDAWLLPCTPLAADSASQTIGPSGGSIDVGPHRLVVPSEALDSAVTITAIMPSDSLARIRLLPEGLTFERRPRLEMSYAHCAGAWIPVPRQIVYLDLDLNVLEVLETLTNIFEKKVSTRLDHFSDYAVAW